MDFHARYITLVLAASISIVPLTAATISVQIVEKGLSEDAPMIEASSAWESGALDAIFDSGNIACNAPILRLIASDQMNGHFPKEITFGVSDARNGGAEYLVLYVVVYEDAAGITEVSKLRLVPRLVAARLVQLTPLTIIYEEEKMLAPTLNGKDDEKSAKEFTRKIISRVKER